MYDHEFRQQFSIKYFQSVKGRYTVYRITASGHLMLGEIIRISGTEWFFFPVVREQGEFYFGSTRSAALNACFNFY